VNTCISAIHICVRFVAEHSPTSYGLLMVVVT